MSEPTLTILSARGRRMRAEALSQPLPVRLSPAERERVRVAARVNHQNVSQFARDALVTAADDCLERAIRNT
jgi:uncharacterized protein (DUF1778 family)